VARAQLAASHVHFENLESRTHDAIYHRKLLNDNDHGGGLLCSPFIIAARAFMARSRRYL
jgi:hypothetical protein